ncbi:MAG: hypothetical protein HY348_04060 [Nitrospira defluvii]|nr:hypothetical protein [Nitrospira defluvii]
MPYHSARTRVIVGFLFLAAVLMSGTVAIADATPPPAQPSLADRFPAFQEVMRATAAQLASLSAQGDSLILFKNVIGPRLGLNDAAMTVGAKGLSPAMTKELLLADLTQSATELVRGLAAWHLAQAARDLGASATAEQLEGVQRQIDAQMAWFTEGTPLEPSLLHLLAFFKDVHPQGALPDTAAEPIRASDATAHMAGAVAQVETWAIQTVHREWFRLLNWKDQVRQQRGLVRLCGTWQWSIHNHQNHREEKTAVIFAPPGATSATSPAEIIVLGDSVYLRWETRAGVQEDSLLFSGEGQRLEGTFVNTAGGWGSITGKRTASCFPQSGEKPAAGQRRHH